MLAIGVPLVIGAGIMVLDELSHGLYVHTYSRWMSWKKREKDSSNMTNVSSGPVFLRPEILSVQSAGCMVTYWIREVRRPE